MKKFFCFSLAVLFVVALAGVTLAADTTFSGSFRVRAWSEWNFDKKFNDIDDAEYDGWFDQRFRLKVTHTRSEYLKAVIQFDLVEDTWGQGRALYMNKANAGDIIDYAYLQFKVDPVGTFRIGKIPVDWGHGLTMSRKAWAFEGLEWSNKWGMVDLTLLYLKIEDGVINNVGTGRYNQDGNLFALRVGVKPSDDHYIQVFGGYYGNDDYAWSPRGLTLTAELPVASISQGDLNLGFVGLAYTGNFSDMIDVKFEGSALFGDLELNVGGVDTSYDVFGWNIYLDVSYYNDLLRVGAAFLARSGDWDDVNINSIYDESFAWANIIGNDASGNNSVYRRVSWFYGNGQQNIISAKLYFEICPMDKLSINAAVIWAQGLEDIGPTSIYRHPVNSYDSSGAIVGWEDSKDIGWELDLGLSYEIMEGLTYTFAGGVLFTGDAWDYNNGGSRDDWGTIWSVSNTLEYKF